MKTQQEIESALNQFSGTSEWLRYSPLLFPNVVLTDGTKWLAENADCYWLMDAISSYQPECAKDEMLRDFQVWTLKVNPDKSATLICERDTNDVAFTQKFDFTTFPLLEIKMYCNPLDEKTQCILLTSEY